MKIYEFRSWRRNRRDEREMAREKVELFKHDPVNSPWQFFVNPKLRFDLMRIRDNNYFSLRVMNDGQFVFV